MDALISIEKACFPQDMQDTTKDFKEFFADEYATGILLCSEGQPIGYISGTHINEENSGDVLEECLAIKENEEFIFYADSVALLDSYRSPRTLDYLIHELVAWLRDNDYRFVTAHIRRNNGFSRLMQSRYGAQKIKRYPNWMGFNEPFDYLLMDFCFIPTLPMLPDYLFQMLRRTRALMKQNDWPD